MMLPRQVVVVCVVVSLVVLAASLTDAKTQGRRRRRQQQHASHNDTALDSVSRGSLTDDISNSSEPVGTNNAAVLDTARDNTAKTSNKQVSLRDKKRKRRRRWRKKMERKMSKIIPGSDQPRQNRRRTPKKHRGDDPRRRQNRRHVKSLGRDQLARDDQQLLAMHQVRRARRRRARRARHNATITPIRHHDRSSEGIRVGPNSRDPPQCPPPAKPFVPELCNAPACLTHRQCRGRGRARSRGSGEQEEEEGELMCCFNGCVHTCLPAVDSPPVIDWFEDSGSKNPILDETAPPASFQPIRYEEPLSFSQGGGEEVRLPGGCTISGPQYTQLQDFMRGPSIQSCMCNKGEVVCSVKMFNT